MNMPTPNSSKKAHGVVARLVEEKSGAGIQVSPEAREFVACVLEHNDTQPRALRISRVKAAETLESEFGIAMSPQTLERWVRRELERSSWGRK